MASGKETQDRLFGLYDEFMRRGQRNPEDIMQLISDAARTAVGGTARELDEARTVKGRELAANPATSEYELLRHHASALAVRSLAFPVDGLMDRYRAEYPVEEKPNLTVVPDIQAEVA